MKRAQDGEGRAVVALYPNGFQALGRVEGEVKLPLMYDRLNCTLVEVVRLSPTVEMWVDEEGLITGRPVNALATALAGTFGLTHQRYHGPALVCGVTPDDTSVGLDWDTINDLTVFGASARILRIPAPRVPDFRTNGGGL